MEGNLAIMFKPKNALDPAIPLLGIYPTNILMQNDIHKGASYSIVWKSKLAKNYPIVHQ